MAPDALGTLSALRMRKLEAICCTMRNFRRGVGLLTGESATLALPALVKRVTRVFPLV
jgi:hypothetical protein